MLKSPEEAVLPMAKQHELWSLREDVSVECGSGDDPLRLRGRWGDVTVMRPSSLVHEALRRMSLGPVSLENVIGTAGGDAQAQREHLHRALERLSPLIVRSLSQESGDPVLSVVPLAERSRFRPVPLAPEVPVRMSVFARLRANGRECNIESPLALHRVVLHQAEAVRLIAPLMSPITPAAYLAAVASADPVARNALEYLVAAGMAVAGEPSAGGTFTFAEDRDPATVGWSQIDMMFHTRSTLGRHDHDFGATCPIAPLEPPVKAVKPVKPGQQVPLHRPRLEDLRATDPPLTAVIEGRRSNRHPGAEITAEQIGDLLYRTARVRRLAASTPGDFSAHTDRPYPSGGNSYELELYLSVGDCAGLAPGVYHYDPLKHRLEPVDGDRVAAAELLAIARMAAGTDAPLPVLITMTARFRRLSWRYEGMAYRLVLMNAGALMQNLYLVCTAMRLAPCAIGTISIDTAARALGTDWRVEPCVAQFMVGSQPAVTPGDGRAWSDVNDGWWAGAARELPRSPRELLGIAVLAAHYGRMLDAAVTILSRDDPAYAGVP